MSQQNGPVWGPQNPAPAWVAPPVPVKRPGHWYTSRFAVAVAAGVVGLAVGASAGGGGSSSGVAAAGPTTTATTTVTATKAVTQPGAPGATVTATATVETTRTVKTTVTAKPAPPAAAIEEDGIYEIGVDLQAGTYRGTGSTCYWARLSNASGDLEAIVANGNGPAIVTIAKSDKYFESRRCTWTKR